MTEWTPEFMERIFELYEQFIDCLEQDVAKANVSLGSTDPKHIRLQRLTRAQFESMLTNPAGDQEAIKLWVRRIIRGHENEFPAHQAAG